MKVIILLITAILIFLLTFQLIRLYNQKNTLQTELLGLQEKTLPLNAENNELSARIQNLNNPDNLEKELRSQFNYAKPGEKLIIIVPP